MSLLGRLSTIKELPTLPETVIKVQSLTSAHDSDAFSLAQVIEEDLALAAKILKIANSTFYGSVSRRISSVQVAVTRMGFEEVKNISVAMSLINTFGRRKSALGYMAFWKHSIDAGYLMKSLAALLPMEYDEQDIEHLFLAGLFHDLGLLILDQFYHDVFEQVMECSLSREISFLEAERIILGKETHGVIGGALLELWRLSPAIIDAVRYHHSPEKCPEKSIKYVVPLSITEYVLCNGRIGSMEGVIDEVQKDGWSDFGITPELLKAIFSVAEAQVAHSNTIIALSNADLRTPLRMI